VTTEAKLDRLTGIVEGLANTVVAHDNQIESLIQVAEKNLREILELKESMRLLERQWQAYLSTLPRN
jgi:rRNA pseudouridine-1189 N-methylase Emg1 (Nep1/Mra1 family)